MAKRPVRRPVGRKARELRRKHFLRRLGTAALGVVMVLVAAAVIGGLVRGLGFWGVMLTVGAMVAVATGAISFPRFDVPDADDLLEADLESLAGKTEIWLETQRPALPPPAATLVDAIGVQLDQLAPQLSKLDDREPAAYEIRRLVGEHLPGMIRSFRSIPDNLQNVGEGGDTPAKKLVGGLTLVEQEIANVTRQIAQGHIDQLSTTGRFLELKYDRADSDKHA